MMEDAWAQCYNHPEREHYVPDLETTAKTGFLCHLFTYQVQHKLVCLSTEVGDLPLFVFVWFTAFCNGHYILRHNTRNIVSEGSQISPSQLRVLWCIPPHMCPNIIWGILWCYLNVRSMHWWHNSVITKYRFLLCAILTVVCVGQ